MKFHIVGARVCPNGSISFGSCDEAAISPLAEVLFQIEGIVNVFFGPDFISLNKREDAAWDDIKPKAMVKMVDHFSSKVGLFYEGKGPQGPSLEANSEDEQLVKEIKEVLDTRIKPMVEEDGGSVVFHSFKDGVVTIELVGACADCPHSTVTLKHGIQRTLQYYVPEVVEVRNLNEDEMVE
jgi:Fe-S cluster biogenesis protein NfuA